MSPSLTPDRQAAMIGVADYADDPKRRERQLAEVGVSEQILLAALGAGLAARKGCTANHPKMAPSMYMYLETVSALGEQTNNLGWTREDYKGFATIRRSDGLVAIAVASGSDGTGDAFADVTTRSPKGAATQEAVEQNLSLPYDERYVAQNERIAAVAAQSQSDNPQTVTWFLLHDIRGGMLYSELSCPRSIDRGYVALWEPRIPLTAQPLDPVQIDMSGEPPINPIVDVKRRDPV